ncbi:L-ascorbate metabolism protein UlaG, beta-lactamase superfamily [Paenibacillus algorifonticola]|uniref:L-ascorbate metabolism protein UlaG, beta-lactamase superfamily n=1 Tax=Paenibacillus algorifonticola TaxID=684063 RepID=A0A1I2ITS3_9BACL|nr:MBL fold metallo-hydrolase [Paenibacillus algorifonticola]SFF45120.1 L-ascorbate metabolism protein UlaG, beta-lactamase superfamily [Paenibacillus algorifonticola]
MKIQQIRNATIVIEYAGYKFLVDPFLAEKGTYPPFSYSIREDRNPLVDLPVSIESLLSNLDAVILTHLHLDHYDDVAKKIIPKDIKMFVQNQEDADIVQKDSFTNVEVLQEDTAFNGIQLVKTTGEHGRGELLKMTGLVCGVVFKHSSEKTLYVAGDTVWYEAIHEVITTYKPDVIVVNGGDNQILQMGSLVMEKDDIYEVYKVAPNVKIISVHMEAVNHWGLSREELKNFVDEKGISDNVFVPEDGDSYTI